MHKCINIGNENSGIHLILFYVDNCRNNVHKFSIFQSVLHILLAIDEY